MKDGIVIFSWIFFLVFSCSSDQDPPDGDSDCEDVAVVSENRWRGASMEGYVIEDAVIEGDCLLITLAASGCNGESWRAALLDSGAIAESLPPQRSIRIDFINPEACLAFFRRTYSFDLRPLRTSSPSVFLRLDGWEGDLLYEHR